MAFDWGKFNKTIKKKFGGKTKAAGKRKTGRGHGNAWKEYIGSKKR